MPVISIEECEGHKCTMLLLITQCSTVLILDLLSQCHVAIIIVEFV